MIKFNATHTIFYNQIYDFGWYAVSQAFSHFFLVGIEFLCKRKTTVKENGNGNHLPLQMPRKCN